MPGSASTTPTRRSPRPWRAGQLAYYELLERRGLLRMIRTGRRPREALGSAGRSDGHGEPIGYILAMEGADPIVEPSQAVEWWNLGLRSVNLAHYGKSRYAVGTGDDGPLTPGGRPAPQGVRAAGHDPGRDPPLRHQLLPGPRRLPRPGAGQPQQLPGPGRRTAGSSRDEQIRLLIERGAVIGAALDAWMLAPGWIRGQTSREVVRLEAVADHIDHVCQLAGYGRHAAIGSDLDGGFGTEQTPVGMDRISDLQDAGGDPGAPRLRRAGDRRHLPRQLAALLPQELAGMTR